MPDPLSRSDPPREGRLTCSEPFDRRTPSVRPGSPLLYLRHLLQPTPGLPAHLRIMPEPGLTHVARQRLPG
ncbi:hypothetical protein GCM10027070_05650 [Barrientosiimonas humi]